MFSLSRGRKKVVMKKSKFTLPHPDISKTKFLDKMFIGLIKRKTWK